MAKKRKFKMPANLETRQRPESATEQAKRAFYETHMGSTKPENEPEVVAALKDMRSKAT